MANMLLVNPRKRRKARSRKKASTRVKRRKVSRRRRAPVARISRRRRRNPIARRVSRRRRRNPIGLNLGAIKSQVMDSAIGASGAVVLDVALSYLPVPASLKTGAAAPLIKGAAAIVLGMVASKVVSHSAAAKMTNGALTVMLHGIIRNTVGRFAPNIQMGEFDDDDGSGMFDPSALSYYGSGEHPALNEYLSGYEDSDGVAEYLSGTYDAPTTFQY